MKGSTLGGAVALVCIERVPMTTFRNTGYEVARDVIALIENKGWDIKTEPLKGRKRRTKATHFPGVRLMGARKRGGRTIMIEVRDWSAERYNLEAACLFAKKAGVPIDRVGRSNMRRAV